MNAKLSPPNTRTWTKEAQAMEDLLNDQLNKHRPHRVENGELFCVCGRNHLRKGKTARLIRHQSIAILNAMEEAGMLKIMEDGPPTT